MQQVLAALNAGFLFYHCFCKTAKINDCSSQLAVATGLPIYDDRTPFIFMSKISDRINIAPKYVHTASLIHDLL
jgi:hypothetical protein